jgi:uncharacterized protein
MIEQIVTIISGNLELNNEQVSNTIQLLDGGATIPFISRYRKEVTGSLNEVVIEQIANEVQRLRDIEKRKLTILKTIDEQGKLTNELRATIEQCYFSTELEDLYLPYRPKKKTRATRAIERGLEPLARILMKQQELHIEDKAASFLGEEVPTIEDALTARAIL